MGAGVSRSMKVDPAIKCVPPSLARSQPPRFGGPCRGGAWICLKAPPFVQDIALLFCSGTRAMPRNSSGSIQSHGVMRKQSESDSFLSLLTRIAMHKGMDPYLRERVMSGMGPGMNQGREACAGHMPVRFVRRMSTDTHTSKHLHPIPRSHSAPPRSHSAPPLFSFVVAAGCKTAFLRPLHDTTACHDSLTCDALATATN